MAKGFDGESESVGILGHYGQICISTSMSFIIKLFQEIVNVLQFSTFQFSLFHLIKSSCQTLLYIRLLLLCL